MRKIFAPSFHRAIGAALVAAGLFASGAASAEIKVGTLRVEDVLRQSPQFKAGEERMRSEFEKRQKDFESEVKKFQADAEKFAKEKDLLSPSDRATREKNLSSTQVDLGYKKQQLQTDVQDLDRKLMQDLQVKIKSVIEQIAKDRNLDLILRDPIFASDALDITDEVLKALGGPAVAAKPAAVKPAADKKAKK